QGGERGSAVQIEIQELALKYRGLRIADRSRHRQLVSALVEYGQQTPVLVVAVAGGAKPYVLIDGYARVAALASLGRDLVEALVLPLAEPEALVFGHRLEASRRPSVLEEAWLVRALIEGHGKSQAQLAAGLQRSVSWVNRRLSLVRVLPESVQEAVQRGVLSAQAAMKYLVPLARAKRVDCEQLVAHLRPGPISVRQMQRLYEGWKQGNREQRARLLAHPRLYLKVQEEDSRPVVAGEGGSEAEPLAADFEALAAMCRRVRRQVRGGLLDRSIREEREAMIATWREVRLIFASLEKLIDRQSIAWEGGHARSGYPHGDLAPEASGTRDPNDCPAGASLTQCGPARSA
ncbi:MAG: ParB/RepB/Spo0J family partition protein, partial [Candidatus Eisenbacteria sp.]|nr:ParB/RepB/Spo0J family partition protein [Candidatus Eisenbacteria bacterium]